MFQRQGRPGVVSREFYDMVNPAVALQASSFLKCDLLIVYLVELFCAYLLLVYIKNDNDNR